MAAKSKDAFAKQKKKYLTTTLYVGSAVTGLIGLALLINNIIIFKTTVDQYVAQGYPAEAVLESLVPAQLLPGVLEPLAMYGGMAVLLFGLAKAIRLFIDMFCDDLCDQDEEEEIQEYFKVFSLEDDDSAELENINLAAAVTIDLPDEGEEEETDAEQKNS